ncbi:hypothetical protein [Streptomyces avicenniae]|uniref:hypothetical protein n=1 Tax=Streptomyces avicenniae TaxID=500153 RepID=UPI0006992DAD|nr:hypothetical protein [Streptomyces avicenniae]
MTADTRLADELLEGLLRRAYAQKWSGHRKKRFRLAELLDVFRNVHRAGPDSDLEETTLNGCLATLAASGHIDLMADRAGEALPPGIHLLPVRALPAIRTRQGALYHPALHELIRSGPRPRGRQEVAYKAISDWLHSLRGSLIRVPLRERALEIFGKREYAPWFPEPEKCLDGRGFGGPLFGNRAQLCELIHAFPTDPPLLDARFRRFDPDTQSTALVGGDILLVVENSATYTSLVRCLRAARGAHRIACIAWGVGHSFPASVRSLGEHYGADIEGRLPFRAIRYFGDLDVSGLRIPIRASAAAAEVGLPPVQPTPSLYRKLLTEGVSLPGRERSTRAEAETLTKWLGVTHDFGPVVDVLERGERWAQEWVGLRLLSLSDDWLADMS